MEEEERKVVSEEWKDERPFSVLWDTKSERWIMHLRDEKTNEVIEKKVFLNGGWRKLEDKHGVVRKRR